MNHLRLQEVLTTIQSYFEKQFSGKMFWCCAEVLHIKIYKQRVYIDLVEYDTTGAIVAKMKGIIRDYELLVVYMRAHGLDTPDQLIGNKLLGEMSCSFHAQWGMSLSIHALSREFAVGQFHLQQQAVRSYLQEQGIYQNNQNTTFGLPPVRLAIISSSTSEGFRDFVTILDQSNRKIEYQLFEARVHGDQARGDIADQLKQIGSNPSSWSAIIITRGGGGSEGLSWQNDREIAECICRLPLPVILATGHTSDTSLLDEIVRYAAKTPSDAAHLLIDGMSQQQQRLTTLYESIETILTTYQENCWRTATDRYEAIQQSCTETKKRLEERVDAWRDAIQMMNPLHQLDRGYALVYDAQHEYITKQKINGLQSGDRFYIQIYDQELEVVVKNRILRKRDKK